MEQSSLLAPKTLDRSFVHLTIDEVCSNHEENLRRAESSEISGHDLLYGFVLNTTNTTTEDAVSVHSYLATFYFAYSTWDGRVLYLDQCCPYTDHNYYNDDINTGCSTVSKEMKVFMFRILAEIAVRLQCSRFTWQYYDKDGIHFPLSIQQPEKLDGWLTLHWLPKDIRIFLNIENIGEGSANAQESKIINNTSVRRIICDCLEQNQEWCPDNYRIRLSTEDDVTTIQRLVQGLAIFEKEPDAVNTTMDHFRNDGFQGEQPLFYCLLLDEKVDGKNDYYTCGMSFVFIGCKIDVGTFLYLEDLFLEQEYRGKGAGTAIMKTLGAIALSINASRLVWQALDWNTPALTFYNKIGANVVDSLLTARFAGDDLKSFSTIPIDTLSSK